MAAFGDGNALYNTTMDELGVSPVREIHSPALRNRILNGKKAKNPVNTAALKGKIRTFVLALVALPRCYNIRNTARDTKCSCLSNSGLLSGGSLDLLVIWLWEFALKKREEQLQIVVEWVKYSRRMESSQRQGRAKLLLFIIPGTAQTPCCKDAICRLIGWGSNRWDSCMQIAKGTKAVQHGSLHKTPNARKVFVTEQLTEFFENMKQLACPRATLFVRGLVTNTSSESATTLSQGLKNGEEVFELPSATSKRSLYGRYLREHGWRYSVNYKGSTTNTEALPHMDQQQVCSWPTFVTFWNSKHASIVIARPRADICNECYIYANRHKYLVSKQIQMQNRTPKGDDQHFDGDTDDEEEDDPSDAAADPPTTGGVPPECEDVSTPMDDIIKEQEALILNAARHVEMAKIQREYYQNKKQEAIATTALEDPTQRSLCYVADYAQNMGIPSFAYEQPGETYYYSPLNVYCFGVVDCSKSPEKMTAYCYTEDVAKKGGNNVTSLLWLHLRRSGVAATTRPFKEITFIFDNCGGQNKNRMVLRFLFFLVKLRVATVARAAFLIRGHTKNDCDRLFNLMKKKYRKSNIYDPTDLCSSLVHKQVDPVLVQEWHFNNWDALEEPYIKRPAGEVNSNHMFEVNANVDSGNSLIVAEAHGYPSNTLKLVKKEYLLKDSSFWSNLLQSLSKTPVTGIQDIKWKELHDKWGTLVPEEKRTWRYFTTDISKEQREKIASNSKKSRQARSERTRTDNSKRPPTRTATI